MIERTPDTAEAGGEDAEIIMDVYCLKTQQGSAESLYMAQLSLLLLTLCLSSTGQFTGWFPYQPRCQFPFMFDVRSNFSE